MGLILSTATRWRRRQRGDDSGAVAVIVAVFVFFVVFAVLALVADMGRAYTVKAQLQNAADSAALAAARDLSNTATAKSTAVTYAGVNGQTITTADVTTPYLGDSSAVRVVVKQRMPLLFLGLLGKPYMDISATATAAATSSAGYAVFAGHDFTTNGGIQVVGALYAGAAATFNGTNALVTGGVDAFTISANGNNTLEPQHQGVALITPAQYATTIGLTAAIAALPTGSARATYASDCTIDTNWYATHATIQVIDCGGQATVTDDPPIGHPLRAIIANNEIQLNPKGNNRFAFGSTTNSFLFYSKVSNVTLKPHGMDLYGTIYAPGGLVQGDSSASVHAHGRIIAKDVTLNGTAQYVDASIAGGGGISVSLTQ